MSGDHLVAIEDWRINTPAMLADARKRWHLETGPAYPSGSAGLVFPATRRDGSHVVVKLILPHREAEHEADALAAWNGNGAVKLIDRTSDGWILLLERCEPGTPLAAADPNTAISIFAHLLPRLWLPAADSSFTTLRDEAHHWLGSMRANWERAGRPFDQRVLDATMEALAHLAETQGEQVLLHQDLHGDNVLSARREPWLVIDPKPLSGEREFAVAPIIRSFELGHTRGDATRRLDRLTAELGLDRDRARWWTIGQTIAWSFEATHRDRHLSTVEWLL